MQDSNRSVSEGELSFDQLAWPVRRWIRKQGWPALRSIQVAAIPLILAGGDVIVSAATASGKTEAAFLPLVSRVLASGEKSGFRLVYLAPLKALINDQHRRLEGLCQDAGLPLHKWHGDVPASAKTKARSEPGGILLITPESLEATLVRRGGEIGRLFGAVDAFLIDELHAFIGTERGVQLLSLMSRIEKVAGRRIDRIGLSATLGDMQLAADALRIGASASVRVVEDPAPAGTGRIDLRIRTFEAEFEEEAKRDEKSEAKAAVDRAIAEELHGAFGGSANLVFANSRANVEVFSDMLRQTSERAGVRNAFLPHHGKLSKELRECAEAEIKDKRLATTIVATSTLEMGVDIGAVEAVAQIDAASSVAALRQRVGRSGRRDGQRPVLRQYVRERAVPAHAPLRDQLRIPLVHAIAVTELLRRGWCEPPLGRGLHCSTLIHQTMAIIAQNDGRSALSLYSELCIDGPFKNITPGMYQALLRSMAGEKHLLIEQASDGTLLLGRKGEKRADHFTFYAVFPTPEEYRVVSNETTLGTIEPDPLDCIVGAPLLFAGRRWDIREVDCDAKVIRVVPAQRTTTKSSGGRIMIHEEIGRELRKIYRADSVPDTLDDTGERILGNARTSYRLAGLETRHIQGVGPGFELFPWTGTLQLNALALALTREGFSTSWFWPVLYVRNASLPTLRSALEGLAAAPPPDIESLRGQFDPRTATSQKFDYAVPDELLAEAYLTEHADLASVPRLAAFLLGAQSTDSSPGDCSTDGTPPH